MILDVLLKLPPGTKNLKQNITMRLGLVGQMSTTRDINAAWNETKKKLLNSTLKNSSWIIETFFNGMTGM